MVQDHYLNFYILWISDDILQRLLFDSVSIQFTFKPVLRIASKIKAAETAHSWLAVLHNIGYLFFCDNL